MNISIKKLYRFCDKIIIYLTTILFAVFYLILGRSYEAILLTAAPIVIIGILLSFIEHGRITFKITYYHYWMLFFFLFCCVSSLVAINWERSIFVGMKIFLIMISMIVLYLYFQRQKTVDYLLKVIMRGGNIVQLFIICFYMPQFVASINDHTRFYAAGLFTAFLNPNEIGMMSSMCFIINIYYILLKNKRIGFENIFLILNIVMSCTSGSRKAVVMLAIGTWAIFFIKYYTNKNILKCIGIGVVCLAVIYFILQLPMFALVKQRLLGMFVAFEGRASFSEGSTLLRLKMVQIGIETFWENPIFGIGMGNSGEVLGKVIPQDCNTYFHNNFVELLACGGLVGFCLYYSIYAYLLKDFIRLWRYRDAEYAICLVLLLLQLVMDFGVVSYSEKQTFFYFMVFSIYTQQRRREIAL